MKTLILISILVHSTLTFAGYQCQEKDSALSIDTANPQDIKAIYFLKDGKQTVLKGLKLEANPEPYYEIQNYDLKDNDGNKASIKISIMPVMTPCHGRRYCGPNTPSVKISAELDYQGKVTSYECQEETF